MNIKLLIERDKIVETIRADALRRMEQREREIFDQDREITTQVEDGNRMTEIITQATINELQQSFFACCESSKIIKDHNLV